MKIIIPTCDKYRNLLEANKYTMDKFSDVEFDVIVLGYKKPDFDLGSWGFYSLGEDLGAQKFTNPLFNFFNTFNDEYFIYGNDDGVITNKINHNFLNDIEETIKEIQNFGRCWLTGTNPHQYGLNGVVKDFGEYQLARIQQTAKYRLSLHCSVWKTSYFKKYLRPDLSPWGWETRGDAINDGANILIPINNFVFSLGHLMKRETDTKSRLLNNWYKSVCNDGELDEDDIKHIKSILKKHNYE